MMNKKLKMLAAMVTMVGSALAATPTITDVTAQQRYPWNGKVDISYTVTGDIAAEAKQRAVFTSLKVTAIDKVANTTNIATQLSGDTALTAGTHKFVWDMNAEGLTFKSSNVVFNVSCEMTPATYCVIDLSAGANATSYPVTYLASPPSGGFNVEAYKTTKLVLRRIEAGTFTMGEGQNDESHRVTLTKPFFCGLFEVTQKQYTLVTGANPSSFSGDTLPVEKVSYNMIRGSSNGAKWPSSSAVDSSSFMGKLRSRTGLDFDLPTEAQWEYACRAGTTTTYSYGNSANGNYMWYTSNSSSTTHPVGSKSANPWGLYDMHGNVSEWCLDWYGTLAYGTDSRGSSSGADRIIRGGCWNYLADRCTSSIRNIHYAPSYVHMHFGFRLVRTIYQPAVTVTFDANGGAGVMATQSLVPGRDSLSPCTFTRTDYAFSGWATNVNGEAVYQDLENAELNGDVTLYAVWTPATYCVIDLSAGANATSYPVTYLAEPPSGGFNVDEYKTTKLVLKRLEAGTFIMGEDQNDESHRVTLTKPFFCGLFEVTQKQYTLVTGTDPCSSTQYGKSDSRPVHYVSYDMIRGSLNGAKWPLSSAVDSSSFMGKMRVLTGLDFDLPTDAQWEYACRAGTTTKYYWGDSMNDDYAWYEDNSINSTHTVGGKAPNAWGIYDMNGNVWEWCLDWYGTLAYGTDPQGSSSGSNRVRRGGSWLCDADICASSYRSNVTPSYVYDGSGFRIVRTIYRPAVTVTFDANGGAGVMATQSLVPGRDSLSPCTFTRTDYAFNGWATNVNGEAVYQDLENAELNGDVTLYAVWTPATYCVIDLSGGANATSYPVTYLAESPSGGFNVDAYKTSKLVLKRIEAGTFMMGGLYNVTLTKPYYCGVFEVTQKQYELVMGDNPSSAKGDMRPVETVSWNMIHGHASIYNWPTVTSVDPSKFVGRLQSHTGLNFDLPTEAQWEYACRAGTTSAYNNGGASEDDLKLLGRYIGNLSDNKGGYSGAHTVVGSYLPNAFGLYDMHGNVCEWCLDYDGILVDGMTDPQGPSSGVYRIRRGGGWDGDATFCTSSNRDQYEWNDGSSFGFRIVRTLP